MPIAVEERTNSTALPGPQHQSQLFIYEGGFVYACDGMVAPRTERYTGTVLLATTERDLDVEVAGRRFAVGAVLMRPFVPKALHAPHAPMLSVAINPKHPQYRAFTRLGPPGYVIVPRTFFKVLRPHIKAVRDGTMGMLQGQRLFTDCVQAVTALLAPLRPLDARIERGMAMLKADPTQPLESLADAACLSYYRYSHLFSNEMGISLRQYVLSLKIHAACHCIGSGMSLTATAHAAGFTDSAHLSRVWAKAFGGPPTQFLNPHKLSIQSPLAAAPGMVWNA